MRVGAGQVQRRYLIANHEIFWYGLESIVDVRHAHEHDVSKSAYMLEDGTDLLAV